MHDLLFENQPLFEDAHLLRYARACNLDLAKFAADLESEAVVQRIKTDFLSGARSGVNGTPTFFVDGERYDGSWEAEDFLAYLTGMGGAALR
jgi:protein-disulfide isomerase